MNSYKSSYNTSPSRTRRQGRQDPSVRRDDRDVRRNERMQRRTSRSVGATSLAAPSAQALGLVGRNVERPRGRGQTARLVEQERAAVYARPAVYTQETRQPLLRLPQLRLSLPRVGAPSFSVPTFAIVVLVVVAALAFLYRPARTYYSAWREAGVLQAEYEVLQSQNGELTHELERLQTLEGIEDEARSRGYVYPNEEALVVTGIEEERVADPALVDEALAAHEQGLPWYVSLLDALFAYSAD